MSLRMIELILSHDCGSFELKNIINLEDIIEYWEENISSQKRSLKFLVPTEKSSLILDQLEKTFSGSTGFRLILYPVEAALPRIQKRPEKSPPPSPQPETKKIISSLLPLSREELYNDIEKTVSLNWTYCLLIVLSALVASIGILKNNEVIIIGAMVLAPLLGPNVALSLATTLGDISLAKRAIKSIALSASLVLMPTILIGLFVPINPNLSVIISRTEVGLADVVLALAAGSAAALSMATELYAALIGVMVAVALLPPLVTAGLLIGAGQWPLAGRALLLFLTNLIGINLSGVVTFIIQGIRPLTWWEKTQAKKATRFALLIWIILLAILILAIYFNS